MIEALIFDYGGVVSDGGGNFEPAARLANHLGINDREAIDLIRDPWNRLSAGTIDVGRFWHELQIAHGFTIPDSLKDIWNTYENCMEPRNDILRFLQTLKSSGYILGLISNTVPPTAQSIKNHGGYELFDFTILSFEVGLQKPDPKIYEMGLAYLHGIAPDHIVYVDDSKYNLPPAQKLGMKAVLANNATSLIDELTSMVQGK